MPLRLDWTHPVLCLGGGGISFFGVTRGSPHPTPLRGFLGSNAKRKVRTEQKCPSTRTCASFPDALGALSFREGKGRERHVNTERAASREGTDSGHPLEGTWE